MKANSQSEEIRAFHKHLNICERCRFLPFNLCSEGAALLLNATNQNPECNEWVSNEPKKPQYPNPYYWEWRSKLIIGRPKATKHWSVDELERMGMIGLYRNAT